MKQIPFKLVLESNGYYAGDYSDYPAIRLTWDSERSKQETPLMFGQINDLYNEAVYSGLIEAPYYVQRQKAYLAAGLTMGKINELTAEHAQAVAANDAAAIAKYSAQLADIFVQRQAIKEQYPKPTE